MKVSLTGAPGPARTRSPGGPAGRGRGPAAGGVAGLLPSGGHGALAAGDLLRSARRRTGVEVEDLGGQVERAAGVGDVDDAADPPFDGGRAEEQVGLLAAVAELLEVLHGVEAGPAVGHRRVEVVVRVGVVV